MLSSPLMFPHQQTFPYHRNFSEYEEHLSSVSRPQCVGNEHYRPHTLPLPPLFPRLLSSSFLTHSKPHKPTATFLLYKMQHETALHLCSSEFLFHNPICLGTSRDRARVKLSCYWYKKEHNGCQVTNYTLHLVEHGSASAASCLSTLLCAHTEVGACVLADFAESSIRY